MSPDEIKDAETQTPEPTFDNEPRYNPPETPKKSPKPTPIKTEPNPLLKLAVPRSARGRKISFKDDKEKNRIEKIRDNESDLSDDEAEQDEVLSLDMESKTFTQEIRESRAVVTCKSTNITNTNTCTDLVPLLPPVSTKAATTVSSTELVPVETVEIKPLALSKYPPSWSTSITPASRISVTTAPNNQSNSFNYSG